MVEQFPIVLRGYDKERVDEAFALAQETVDRLRDQVKADDQTILELQAQLQEEKNKKANPNSFASLGANARNKPALSCSTVPRKTLPRHAPRCSFRPKPC